VPYVLIQHSVEDLARFKPVFDDDGARRKMNGSQGGRLFRSVDEPDEFVALFEWADDQGAMKFRDSYEMHEAVEWAGVKGEAKILVLEEIEKVDA
jgi:heme-degrading monooxygenase HmoA